MNPNLNWNYERWRTRDRLIEYDISVLPPCPNIKDNSSEDESIPEPSQDEFNW